MRLIRRLSVAIGVTALLLIGRADRPAAQGAGPNEPRVYGLTLKKDPLIKEGMAAMVQGQAVPDGTRFLLEKLDVLQPVAVTLLAANLVDEVSVRLAKFEWKESYRAASTEGRGSVRFQVRTQGDLRIVVSSKRPNTPYQLLVWVGDEIPVPIPSIFASGSGSAAATDGAAIATGAAQQGARWPAWTAVAIAVGAGGILAFWLIGRKGRKGRDDSGRTAVIVLLATSAFGSAAITAQNEKTLTDFPPPPPKTGALVNPIGGSGVWTPVSWNPTTAGGSGSTTGGGGGGGAIGLADTQKIPSFPSQNTPSGGSTSDGMFQGSYTPPGQQGPVNAQSPTLVPGQLGQPGTPSSGSGSGTNSGMFQGSYTPPGQQGPVNAQSPTLMPGQIGQPGTPSNSGTTGTSYPSYMPPPNYMPPAMPPNYMPPPPPGLTPGQPPSPGYPSTMPGPNNTQVMRQNGPFPSPNYPGTPTPQRGQPVPSYYPATYHPTTVSSWESALHVWQTVDQLARYGESLMKTFQAWDDLLKAYEGLTPEDKGYDPNYMPPGSPSVPSQCAIAGEGCGACFTAAHDALNETRYRLEKLRRVYQAGLLYGQKALAFGDAASGIHGVTGLGWHGGPRKQIVSGLNTLNAAQAEKHAELVGALEGALRKIGGCEGQFFNNPDWYNRYGFLYFSFLNDRYRH